MEGRLQSRKYTDRDGVEKTSVEIVANEMIMLSGRGEDNRHDEGATYAAPARAAVASGSRVAPAGGAEYDDDVPF